MQLDQFVCHPVLSSFLANGKKARQEKKAFENPTDNLKGQRKGSAEGFPRLKLTLGKVDTPPKKLSLLEFQEFYVSS